MASGNEFLPNYVEYMVPLQEKSKLFGKRLMIISVLSALAILIFLGSFTVLSFIPGIIYFLLLGLGILAWYLWRFVSVEYEYTILQGEISFEAVYGKQQRKKVYSTPIRMIEEMGPLNGNKKTAADFNGVTKELFLASTYDNPRTWYAVAKDEKGEKTLFFFETFDKAEKSLRFYNASAIQK